MKQPKALALIGFASGIAANNPDCALGPWYLYYHPNLFHPLSTYWQAIIQTTSHVRGMDVLPLVEKNLLELAQAVVPFANEQQSFCVIGGDHSCGVATWSAVAHANRKRGNIGLIWIDAHMDSHTPETSESKNIHGMPVAHLLGEGELSLRQILDTNPKLKPEHLCLVGIRSYQKGEAELLSRLGVKIYFMEEVQQRGIDVILAEAHTIVTQNTCGYGISVDLDVIDPKDAPGVGCREPDGIEGNALIRALAKITDKKLLGLEIAEYNPMFDEGEKTARLLIDIIKVVYF
jgi:arginase